MYTTQYTIQTTGLKNAKNVINVDKIPILRHPKSILVGGGSLAQKYTRYLDERGFEDTVLLRALAYIHKVGKKEGLVAVCCSCKIGKKHLRDTHSEVIKTFILKNQEMLDTLLPYLFTNEVFTSKTQEDIEKDLSGVSETTKKQLVMNYETNKLLDANKPEEKVQVQLTDDDKNQIADLIKQDQAKNGIIASKQNDLSVDNIFKSITKEDIHEKLEESKEELDKFIEHNNYAYGSFDESSVSQSSSKETSEESIDNVNATIHVPDNKKFFTRLDKEEITVNEKT